MAQFTDRIHGFKMKHRNEFYNHQHVIISQCPIEHIFSTTARIICFNLYTISEEELTFTRNVKVDFFHIDNSSTESVLQIITKESSLNNFII